MFDRVVPQYVDTMKNQPEPNQFTRNVLDQSLSPYLRSHADNPVHWQEWNEETLRYARETDRILLVSVGYSTCHWCHVMAADSFSDPACASYLNQHFVPIKVDREERPDIDQYMMSFLVATTGAGGWPLNAFLSPDLKPFFAMTYAAPEPRFGRPGFLDILTRIKAFYDERKSELQAVPMNTPTRPAATATDDEQIAQIDAALVNRTDPTHGGISGEQKFPPHCSLLYALYRIADEGPAMPLAAGTRLTLDQMVTRGLHDHLQGGFFRYCVDRQWTIPHFEKMLYDQAMLLWNYAFATALWRDPAHEEAATGIVRCLSETFLHDGLLCAAHDADTNHHEGETYLWTRDEIERVLSPEQYAAFEATFELPDAGNFEGKIHLQRRMRDGVVPTIGASPELAAAVAALLKVRRSRPQPFRDEKALTAWNALAGIALLVAGRTLGDAEAARAAHELGLSLREELIRRHVTETHEVIHGSIAGTPLGGRFLEDHAAMLLFLTYGYEEDRRHGDLIGALRDSMNRFRSEASWTAAAEADFLPVPADVFDSPSPSPTALAEFAVQRAAMVRGEPYEPVQFGIPVAGEFQSVAALHTRGYVYTVQSDTPLPWDGLPPHTVQTEGPVVNHCFRGVCSPGLPPQHQP
ncbi:MAG: thioredoxin domain-containing protein [Spirochaetaceae bacterium]|nr:MAG: thioredoxin domain-containing protein [Spirochaetaceae bacterium]